MLEKVSLDMLTQDSVSVKKQKFIVQDNVEYAIGDIWRCAYVNSESGRKQVQEEVTEPYKSVVFMMWGDKPTIEENID